MIKYLILIIFCFIGVYTTLAHIWREYEKYKYGKIIERKNDFYICIIISYIITYILLK